MGWLDIPAQRVLEVGTEMLQQDFERVDNDGALEPLFIRKKDGRVFRKAAIQSQCQQTFSILWLTEV